MLMLAGAIYMLEVYDRVLPSRSVPTLVGLTILLLILYGGQGLLDFVRGRVLVRIGAAVTEALGARLYSSVLKLPQKFGHAATACSQCATSTIVTSWPVPPDRTVRPTLASGLPHRHLRLPRPSRSDGPRRRDRSSR
jgi:hypothetical protein